MSKKKLLKQLKRSHHRQHARKFKWKVVKKELHMHSTKIPYRPLKFGYQVQHEGRTDMAPVIRYLRKVRQKNTQAFEHHNYNSSDKHNRTISFAEAPKINGTNNVQLVGVVSSYRIKFYKKRQPRYLIMLTHVIDDSNDRDLKPLADHLWLDVSDFMVTNITPSNLKIGIGDLLTAGGRFKAYRGYGNRSGQKQLKCGLTDVCLIDSGYPDLFDQHRYIVESYPYNHKNDYLFGISIRSDSSLAQISYGNEITTKVKKRLADENIKYSRNLSVINAIKRAKLVVDNHKTLVAIFSNQTKKHPLLDLKWMVLTHNTRTERYIYRKLVPLSVVKQSQFQTAVRHTERKLISISRF